MGVGWKVHMNSAVDDKPMGFKDCNTNRSVNHKADHVKNKTLFGHIKSEYVEQPMNFPADPQYLKIGLEIFILSSSLEQICINLPAFYWCMNCLQHCNHNTIWKRLWIFSEARYV